jgi:DNA-directed RNA polymerase subunit RPC12/RpoP
VGEIDVNTKCPGQDTRYWKAEDIHEAACPYCGALIEFWKTDLRVRCPECRRKVLNPRFNLGCAEWCSYADKCLGGAVSGAGGTLRRVLENRLAQLTRDRPSKAREIMAMMDRAEAERSARALDPLPALIAALARGVFSDARAAEIDLFLQELIDQREFPPEAVEEARTLLADA